MAMVMTLMGFFYTHPITSNAETTSDIVKTQTCTVNGIKRTITVYRDTTVLFQLEDEEPFVIIHACLNTEFDNIGFDNIGTIWEIDEDNTISWWNYDLTPKIHLFIGLHKPSSTDDVSYVNNAKCLVFDDQGFVTGYKDLSDETHPILTLEEMKKFLNISDDPTPTPTAPTPANTEKPAVTPEPTVSPQPTSAPKVSIKKSSGYTCLSVGNKVVSKYKLKKGVLTWKGTKKSQKVKQVKQAGFIKKSKNLVYITKKGKAYTISQKGKKKAIVKKDAKKLIFKNGFVTKIRKKSGYVNVVNR